MKCTYNDSIKESIYHTKHDTGLDIYVIPKGDFSKYYGIFAVNYGSNDNEFIIPETNKSIIVPDGIAHFLEHKMFEREQGSIFDDYAALGSSPNAYTTFTTTAYHFTASSNVDENIELLLHSVFNPYFTENSIEKEKEIISQEIKMYEDNPNWRVYFNLLDCLYTKYPVKKEVTGTLDSISKINKELLYDCYNTFYHPSNALFLMVGDVNPDSINETIERVVNEKTYEKSKNPMRIYPHEPAKLNSNYKEQKLSIAIPLFAIGFKDNDVGYNGRNLLKKELETSIILEGLFGRSSFIFSQLYDKGLINDTFSSDYIGEKDYGYSLIAGESKDPGKVKNEIQKLITSKITMDEDRFQRIKKKFTGQFISSFNSIESIGSNFVSYGMKNINLFDYQEVLSGIKYKDIIQRFEGHFLYENMALSVISPA